MKDVDDVIAESKAWGVESTIFTPDTLQNCVEAVKVTEEVENYYTTVGCKNSGPFDGTDVDKLLNNFDLRNPR
jgi:Tat protein secretion system quality control protein TatD with DNase activity